MRDLGLANVEASKEFKKVTPGAYICKITKATDTKEEKDTNGNLKEYLKLEYDISEGDLKDYYKDLMASKGFWGGNFIRSYKEKALSFFKDFIVAIEDCNPSYKFDNDENKLVGKTIGLLLAEEEYTKRDNTVGVRLYVARPLSVKTIKSGEFIVPEIKRLAGHVADSISFAALQDGDDELPF